MPSPKQKPQDATARRVQDEWRRTAEAELPVLIANLLEAAKANTRKTATCRHCGKTVEVMTADIRARTDAINALLDRGFGKPQADQGSGGSFTVIRTVVAPEGVAGEPG